MAAFRPRANHTNMFERIYIPRFRFLFIGVLISFVILAFLLVRTTGPYDVITRHISKPPPRPVVPPPCPSISLHIPSNGSWEFIAERDANDHGLSEEQCQKAFPKLFVEVDKSASSRAENNITYEELDSRPVEDGMGRAIIYRGQLYIVEFGDQRVTASRGRATLSSLHRALTSFPDRELLPNIEFIFTTEDFAYSPDSKGPIWSYSKLESHTSVWLMPDFGYWAWPEVEVGPYRQVRQRMMAIDEGGFTTDGTYVPGLSFKDKKQQLVWRGNPVPKPDVRGKLIEASDGHSWDSVEAIDWGSRSNVLPMEDHCRYMFLAHTEGRSYSGRGKYLLNCRSVLISHPLAWREAHHAAFVHSGRDANYVEVESDYSDLEDTIEFLLDSPDTAERIANNSVRTFRDRYLTPAAESCYWRHLVRQYGMVSDIEPVMFTDSEGKEKPRGEPFENWIIMQ